MTKSKTVIDLTHPLTPYLHLGKLITLNKGEGVQCNTPNDDFCFYVKSGELLLSSFKENGTIFYGKSLNEGSLTRLKKLYENKSSIMAEYVAVKKTEIVIFSKSTIIKLIQSDENVLRELITSYETEAEYLVARMISASNSSSISKILSYIYRLIDLEEDVKDGIYKIDFTITQKDLAQMLSVHETTCNRIFAKLKEANILIKKANKIIIYDMDKFIELMQSEDVFDY